MQIFTLALLATTPVLNSAALRPNSSYDSNSWAPPKGLNPLGTVTDGAPAGQVETRAAIDFRDGGDRQLVWLGGDRWRYVDVATGRSAVGSWQGGLVVRVVRDVGDPLDVDDATLAIQSVGLQVVRPLMPSAGIYLAAVRLDSVAADAMALRALQPQLDQALPGGARLVSIFPNMALAHQIWDAGDIDIPPNDPRYPGQFFLEDMDMEAAWAITTGDPTLTVAVIDNGCDLQHPDLAEKMLPGHDVLTGDEDPSYAPNVDGNEHGTACSGLIAAVTDNNLDVAGVCPLCQLRCTRMLGAPSEPVPLAADVQAFAHALDDNVDVVSNSWGFVEAIPVPSALRDAIIEVQQRGRSGLGAVVVFASGNDSREISDDELLAVPGVLGVGAVNNLGELTQFSNSGRSVDVTAPTGTTSTDIAGPDGADGGDVTVRFGGTSSACPLVAGVAALLLSVDPTLTADEVNSAIERTAAQSPFAQPDDAGHDLDYGFGLIQPAAALALVQGPPGARRDVEGGAGCDCTQASAVDLAGPLALLTVLGRRRRRLREPPGRP